MTDEGSTSAGRFAKYCTIKSDSKRSGAPTSTSVNGIKWLTMLQVLPFHSRWLALAVRLLPLNSIQIKQSVLNSSVNDSVGFRNWSRSFSHVCLITRRTVNTIAVCQRFFSVTKNPPALQYPEDNNAVWVDAF